MPKLEYLDISYNKIEKINEGWTGHPNLKILKSVENKFKTLAPFKNMPKLEELYLANNAITALSGYDGLPSLKKLHLRHNKIAKIEEEMPDLPQLEYLNLRTNAIPDLDNLFRLFIFANLKSINVLNCPVELGYSSMNVFMADVLAKNPSMKRFCKVDVTDKYRLEAVYLAKYKWEKAEDERKRLEAEEKAKNPGEDEG